jgi:hypothetical protein
VYVTDQHNQRIQKFVPGYPGWRQSNVDGFGDPDVQVKSLEMFNDELFAATWVDRGYTTAHVYKTGDGYNWTQLSSPWINTGGIFTAEDFGSYIYFGTSDWEDQETQSGDIWRTADGLTWEEVASNGFGDSNNDAISNMYVWNNGSQDHIYAATSNGTTGVEIWRSPSGNTGTWTQVNSDGFGSANTWQDVTFDEFNNYLYVGISRDPGVGELWRTSNGTTWTSVFTDGLEANNTSVSAMEKFKGEFYIGLRNTTSGGQLWKSSNGTSFTKVFDGGLDDSTNWRLYGLISDGKYFYMTLVNDLKGDNIFISTDGTNWQSIAQDGWGDSMTYYSNYFDQAAAFFRGMFFTGSLVRGKIWMIPHMVRLPVALAEED